METYKESRSAGIVAAHRAIESLKGPGARVCYDPWAGRFLPPGFTVVGEVEIPSEEGLRLFQNLLPGFHEFFVARTRYIDDCLQNYLNDGLEQLVILGAGYDSRAYRFDGLRKNVKVFEVDQPATQSVKKEKISAVFHKLPEHVTFIPVDFHRNNLEACLSANGYETPDNIVYLGRGQHVY